MTKSTHKKSDHNDSRTKPARRAFLGEMVAGGVALAGLSVVSLQQPQKSPRELPLREADFYAPHSLAG